MITDTVGQVLSTGVSFGARIFAAACGVALSSWTLHKLSKRELLIPISSLNLAVGLGLAAFALIPSAFDRLSLAIGIKYPPLLYLMLAILTVLVLVLFLSSQISLLDGRCRRLAQEIAMLRDEVASDRPGQPEEHRAFDSLVHSAPGGRLPADR